MKSLCYIFLALIILPIFAEAGTLTVNGNVNINGMTITGKTIVKGNATIRNSTIESANLNGAVTIEKTIVNNLLNVTGNFNGNQSTFKGPATLNGVITCIGCIFQHNLAIHSNSNITLNHSQAHDISINSNVSLLSELNVIMHLSHGTIVNGNITFTKDKGIVYLDGTSKLLGKVINGELTSKIKN